jgi:hypothetical protein
VSPPVIGPLNMNVENYRNVIIGSGEGGKYLAWHLAQSGQNDSRRTALGRGFLPECQLSSQQERNLER